MAARSLRRRRFVACVLLFAGLCAGRALAVDYPVPTWELSNHPSAGVCTKGTVPIGALVGESVHPDFPTVWFRVHAPDQAHLPVTVTKVDGISALALVKAPVPGVHNVTLVAYNGAVVGENATDLQVSIECEASSAGGAPQPTIVDLELLGFSSSHFDASGEGVARSASLTHCIELALGLAESSVEIVSDSVGDNRIGTGAVLQLQVMVPSTVLAQPRRVSLVMESGGHVGLGDEYESLIFAAAGRTLSRNIDVCCSGSVTIISPPTPE